MIEVKKYIKFPRLLLVSLLVRFGKWIPDAIYLHIMYYLKLGKVLHLKNPRTFSEKIQWLKLYNRRPEYTVMVDKVAVKEYVAKMIGDEYIIPTLGVWNNPDEIDFDKLPERFVLKCNHNSGVGLYVCRDKSKLNKKTVVDRLKKGLRENYYLREREWPYRDVCKKILAEKLLEERGITDLIDYKFFCFSGKALYCQMITNRSTHECIDFYDRFWLHQEFVGLNSINFAAYNASMSYNRPINYDKMLFLADKLATSIKTPFVRIDFYNIRGRIYFGEITFYPYAGFGYFTPKEWNCKLGNLIDISL